jgi:hypothetical protein
MIPTTDRITVLTAMEAFAAQATAHPSTPEGYAFIVGEPGKKYTRIVMTVNGRSNSVHCFIDNANGDLYKAAGWKAPAKHVRGNIVTGLDDIMARFTWSGGYLYLR